uniref:Uncharacterized protein n=1 Tax=uncultured marine crenarchaeote AD1000-325-A12 TaxID=526639 RepID=B3V5Q7_9ARCH|nr:hypothetical protein [uncultured marine crenarchaeote AD1000-325-A12]
MKVSILIISLLFLLSFVPNVQGQINDDFITTLDSNIIITEIGSGIINYRFSVTNNGLTAGTFDEDLIFYLPLEYEKKISGHNIISSSEHIVSFSKDRKNVLIKIETLKPISINSGADIGIELELVIDDFIEKTERVGMYKALVPLVTSTNLLIHLEKVSVEVPGSAPFMNVTEQWERRQELYTEFQETSFNNVERKDERFGYIYILENSGQNSFSIIEINDILREIYISNKGDVMIRETITFTNRGFNGSILEFIALDLVGPERDNNNVPIVRNITSVPNREPVVLDSRDITLINSPVNRLPIKEIIRNPVGQGIMAVIKYEYKLDNTNIEINDFSISANIETKSPLNALANNYQIKILNSDSYKIKSQTTNLKLEGNDQFYAEDITIEYSPGIAWASNISLPIGTTLFIIVLLGSMSNIEKPKEEEENEIIIKMKEFTEFYNKKIPTIRNISSGIKKWDKDDIQKKHIDNVKNELNSIKSRTAGEFASLKRDIINLDASQKELFDNITRYEQSFERDIFQMLQLCEQKRLNRINLPELEKRLSDYEKNVDDKINKTIAGIQTAISNLLYK